MPSGAWLVALVACAAALNTKRAPRVWLGDDLAMAPRFALDSQQLRYLTKSMRLGQGDVVRCFGAQLGEHAAALDVSDKAGGYLAPLEELRAPHAEATPFELYFAPLRRKRGALLIEKAVELGVTALRPMRTDRTEKASMLALGAAEKHASAIEAAEQCERLDVPSLHKALRIRDISTSLPVYACVERCEDAPHLLDALLARAPHTSGIAVLVGPEGGFSDGDLDHLAAALPNVIRVSLGPTILRAETAAIVALALAAPFLKGRPPAAPERV